MIAALEVESILNDYYQATVIQTSWRALKLGEGDKICYSIPANSALPLQLLIVYITALR